MSYFKVAYNPEILSIEIKNYIFGFCPASMRSEDGDTKQFNTEEIINTLKNDLDELEELKKTIPTIEDDLNELESLLSEEIEYIELISNQY